MDEIRDISLSDAFTWLWTTPLIEVVILVFAGFLAVGVALFCFAIIVAGSEDLFDEWKRRRAKLG